MPFEWHQAHFGFPSSLHLLLPLNLHIHLLLVKTDQRGASLSFVLAFCHSVIGKQRGHTIILFHTEAETQCGDTLSLSHHLLHKFHVLSSTTFTSSLAFGGLFYCIFYITSVEFYIQYNTISY